MQKILLKHRKNNFNCEGDETLAQWGCGISTFGDTQKPTRHSPAQLSLVDSVYSRGPFQHDSMTLWYKALLMDRVTFLSDEHYLHLFTAQV